MANIVSQVSVTRLKGNTIIALLTFHSSEENTPLPRAQKSLRELSDWSRNSAVFKALSGAVIGRSAAGLHPGY